MPTFFHFWKQWSLLGLWSHNVERSNLMTHVWCTDTAVSMHGKIVLPTSLLQVLFSTALRYFWPFLSPCYFCVHQLQTLGDLTKTTLGRNPQIRIGKKKNRNTKHRKWERWTGHTASSTVKKWNNCFLTRKGLSWLGKRIKWTIPVHQLKENIIPL